MPNSKTQSILNPILSSDSNIISIPVNDSVSIEMVKVEAGKFMMGTTPEIDNPWNDEKTIHQMEVLIQDMIESNISKDISIYTLLFQFTKDQSTHPYLQSFLHLLQQSNYILDSNAYNYLLSFYTSKKNLSISWSILNVMNQNHYYPPWRLYSNILDLAIQYHDVNKITYLVESIEKQKIIYKCNF